MPKPPAFVNNTLQSNLWSFIFFLPIAPFFVHLLNVQKKGRFYKKKIRTLTNIIAQVSCLLHKLADFIYQFNNKVNQTGINVITDSAGNMSIDVPTDLQYYVANKISTRIGTIDRRARNKLIIGPKRIKYLKSIKSTKPTICFPIVLNKKFFLHSDFFLYYLIVKEYKKKSSR